MWSVALVQVSVHAHRSVRVQSRPEGEPSAFAVLHKCPGHMFLCVSAGVVESACGFPEEACGPGAGSVGGTLWQI